MKVENAGPSPCWSVCSLHQVLLHNHVHPFFDVVRPVLSLPTSPALYMMVLHMLSCCMTCPNHSSFSFFMVARRGSWGPVSFSAVFLTYSFMKNQPLVLQETTGTPLRFSPTQNSMCCLVCSCCSLSSTPSSQTTDSCQGNLCQKKNP